MKTVFFILLVLYAIMVFKGQKEGFDTGFDNRRCCPGCNQGKECYAYCDQDFENPCGKKTNDRDTCESCFMCTWYEASPGKGTCVPRQAFYTPHASFAWPGYAPWWQPYYYPW